MTGIITTSEAKCRDCYRCLRSCPVHAIGFRADPGGSHLHAKVDDERCILDGRCVLACPQRAKRVRDDRQQVRDLLAGGQTVAASLAPSFAGALPLDPEVIPGLLRALGFGEVHETAAGAGLVAAAHRRRAGDDRPLITSSCPVVVNLLERHHPEVLPYLAPVVSPMVAHARMLRAANPALRVVFVGPCIAKKREAAQVAPDDLAAVLTFRELWDMWEEAGLVREGQVAATVDRSGFDPPAAGIARLFPLDGGLLKTAGLSTDSLAESVAVVTGLDRCVELIRALAEAPSARPAPGLIEMLACDGGCVGGPQAVGTGDLLDRRRRVLAFHARRAAAGEEPAAVPAIELLQSHGDRRPVRPVPGEAAIRAILARIGKVTPADELNCGACGFDSCRSKAVAVHQGYAELEMCIPYMRAKAESVANVVLDAMPSGVVVTDAELRIIEVNVAACRMFSPAGAAPPAPGEHVSRLTDPRPFREAVSSRQTVSGRVSQPPQDLIAQQTIFYVPEHEIVVGIFTDVTAGERQREKAAAVRSATVARAQDVMNKQMKVAQEIAGLLGETTAETKVLLTKLIRVIEEGSSTE
ncbi:MAG TPA: [Fe-Fe] hydrogenase large subunit C-terminal domain-containing protein [Bacillota bacterium]|nr:[Fe-Fe] hydrogenase large subunit C-terminal domain-containing protein [Bacillota bacterium]